MESTLLRISLAALILLSFASAEIVKQQSFEQSVDDTWGYTPTPGTYYNTSIYSIWSRDNDLPGDPYTILPLPDDSEYLWNCENTMGTSSDLHQLIFDTVDLSSYTGDLTLHFFYYTFYYGQTDGSWAGTGDTIGYYVEYDNNSDWNNLQLLSTGSNDWVDVSIDIPDGSQYLRLCLVCKNSQWQEIGAFDHIYLERTEPPTPITLSDFQASALQAGVKLSWRTESEIENSGFKLYRNGEEIAFIEGAGTTNETKEYSFTDKTALPGCTYDYMLSDISFANIEKKHADMAVTISTNAQDLDGKSFRIGNAYPNPFNPQTAIDVSLYDANHVEIMIFNTKGEKVADLFNGEKAAGSYSFNWNAHTMMSGIYLLKISIGDMIETQKLLLVK